MSKDLWNDMKETWPIPFLLAAAIWIIIKILN